MSNKKLAVVKAPSNVVSIKTPVSGSPEHHIVTELAKYDYDLSHLIPEMRNYATYKMFCMSQSDDGMTALRGIEMLAKLDWVGLFKEKVEVSYLSASDADLKSQLAVLTAKLGLT